MENAAVLAVTGNVIKSNLELHLHFNYLHINFKYKFKPEVGKTILVGIFVHHLIRYYFLSHLKLVLSKDYFVQ